MRYRLRAHPALLAILAGLTLVWPTTAKICWDYSASLPATDPRPWVTLCDESLGETPETHACYEAPGDFGCGATDFLHPRGCKDGSLGECIDPVTLADTGGQTIGEEHRNWHCMNPVPRPNESTVPEREAWGHAFLAFHRQFILDYDIWRLGGFPGVRLEIWDPFQGAPVPGDDETTATSFTHCASSPGTRPAGAVCVDCEDLPEKFRVSGGLGTNFTSLAELGYALEVDVAESPPDRWHRSYHNGVGSLGCNDLADVLFTPNDPAFWLAHNKLDEVARNWLSQNAVDLVIVLDRSGSMDDDCSSSSPPLGETDCKINDAREAARTFADALLDDRGPGEPDHRVALVSFSQAASNHLGLTAADSLMGGAFETQLDGISAGGATSIGAGVREAITILNAAPGGPNAHQAILVLSDGMENVPPCLDGSDDPALGSGVDCVDADEITPDELGHVQVVAVGIGEGAQEPALRQLAEQQGGSFFALEDADVLDLQKFFVVASGSIYDAAVSLDPRGVLKAGQDASDPFEIPVCGDSRLSVVLGQKPVGRQGEPLDEELIAGCDLRLELTTPSGVVVDPASPGVESGHSDRHDFLHVSLPHAGESTGTWTGQVVRASQRPCRVDQEYFYSVLVKGSGRVDPWVVRPQVVVGQPLLASFRIAEPNRPRGGFDQVVATATLERPDGSLQTLPLQDDGTGGDAIAGNHLFSAEFPGPATQAGAHQVRARFELTEGACTRIREAQYSVVVRERPGHCVHAYTPPTLGAYSMDRTQPGDRLELDHLVCLRNACAQEDRYRVSIQDSRGWLQVVDRATGALGPPPESFETAPLGAFSRACDLADGPGFVVIVPEDAAPGDRTEISITIASLGHPEELVTELASGVQVYPPNDCNRNGVSDREDIATGTSEDANGNGIPDECQGHPRHPQLLEEEPPGEEPPPSARPTGCVLLLLVLLVALALLYWRKRRSS